MTIAAVARRAQSGLAAGPPLPFAHGRTLFHLSRLYSAAFHTLLPQLPLPCPHFIRPLVGHSGDHFLHSLEPAA